MTTRTALRHVETALRSRLGIRAPHAREIIDRRPLDSGLDTLDRDVRGCIAVIGDLGGGCRGVALYVPDADGALHRFGELDLLPCDLVRFDAMPVEQAYAIPEGLYLPANDAAAESDGLEVEFDCDPEDMLPETPRAEVFEWRNGTVISHEIVAGHVRAVVEIDGIRSVHAMIPLFGTAAELSSFVESKTGLPARLCVTAPSPYRAVIGIPKDMPVLDMIMPERDVPAIVETYRPRWAA